jgi:hypothetical protein
MIKVGKANLIVFSSASDTPKIPDEWESVALMLPESSSHPGTSVASSRIIN